MLSNERSPLAKVVNRHASSFMGVRTPGHFVRGSPNEAVRKGPRGRDGVLPRSLERQSVSEELARCMTSPDGDGLDAAAGPMDRCPCCTQRRLQSHPSEERRCLPLCGRANGRKEEGSDDGTLMPPPTGEVVGLARLKHIG